jgi:4-diphosphocytidyl-2C-methyl-D-erythritol kinase
MISFQQIRNFFLIVVLTIMLAVTIAFDFGTANSWAATSLKPIVQQASTQIATTENVESQSQELFGIMSGSGDSPAQSAAKTEEFKTKTLEGINNSIGNPDYKLSGKTKGTEKQNCQATKATKDIKAEASEAMDSYQGGDRHSYRGGDGQ